MNPFEKNPFDAKAMGEAWAQGARSFVDAQRSLFEAMTKGAPPAMKPAAMPDLPGFQAAQAAFLQSLTSAEAMARSFADGFGAEGGRRDPVTAEIMAKVFDPRGWLAATSEADAALSRMAEGPAPAELWGVERAFADLARAWLALRSRRLEHDTLMLEAWSRAAGLFAEAATERSDAGEPRDLTALWVKIADDVLRATQRTDAFLDVQRETLKASTDLRLAQREIGEFYGRMFGTPTRSELDDLHRSLTELRREVRTLTREARKRRKPDGEAS